MKYIHIYTVIVLLFCVSSCERFLEEEHETSFTNSSLFETVEGLERMVVGLHNQERRHYLKSLMLMDCLQRRYGVKGQLIL